MNKKRGLLCICAVLLFGALVFHPGYRIIVNGQALPGVYRPETALRCNTAAIRAANEITREPESPPYRLIPVLCFRYTHADPQQLWGILLDSYQGVEKFYAVSAGERQLGLVSDLRQLYFLKKRYFPGRLPQQQLSISETYSYPGAETPMAQVEEVFRQLSTPITPV